MGEPERWMVGGSGEEAPGQGTLWGRRLGEDPTSPPGNNRAPATHQESGAMVSTSEGRG